jgi:hypothetical protein
MPADKELVEQANRIGKLLMDEFERQLTPGPDGQKPDVSPTTLATICRLLEHNGWTVDESNAIESLAEKVGKAVQLPRFDDPEE